MQKVRGGITTKLLYGIGSVAYGVKDNAFSFFLLLYYNQVLGLPAQWVGAAILLALAVDAISDPIVGYISDNLHSRWGRRHPFMYASALPVAVSFYLLWNPPAGLSQQGLLAYLAVMAVLVRTFITLYEIPSSSLAAELTDDYDERTSMLGFRYFFGWWGGLGMAVLTYSVLLQPTEQHPVALLNPVAWQNYGAIAAAIMFVTVMISTLGTHKHIPYLHKPPQQQRWNTRRTLRELQETLSNRSFLVLFVSALFGAMAAGISTSLNVYFNTYFWELSEKQMGTIAMGPFLSSTVALLVAPMLSRRRGKKQAAMLIYAMAIAFAPLPILGRLLGYMPANGTPALLPVLVGFVIIEVGLIVTASILMASMVADTVEESQLRTGRRSEGVFFAARSFIQKSVHGIGVMIATAVLSYVGFPQNAQPGQVDPTVIASLGWTYVPLLVTVYLFSLGFISAYGISRDKHEENVAALRERSEEHSGS